jgi:hypothetical protein
MLILWLFFSLWTPLHASAFNGQLEVSRLLVESKADVAARDRCFSPSPSHHLLLNILNICLAAMATLHSEWSSATTKPPSLHTCAASVRRNDEPPRLLRSTNCKKYSSSSCWYIVGAVGTVRPRSNARAFCAQRLARVVTSSHNQHGVV